MTLDLELQIAVASGASKILVYEGPNSNAGVLDTWNRIATDNLAKSSSSCWGLGVDLIAAAPPASSSKADFFQDGNEDLVFQNNATAQIVFWDMNSQSVVGGGAISAAPVAAYQVVGSSDINGDGLLDLVFQNSSTGQLVVWYMNEVSVIGGGTIANVPNPSYKQEDNHPEWRNYHRRITPQRRSTGSPVI